MDTSKGVWVDTRTNKIVNKEPEEGIQLVAPGGNVPRAVQDMLDGRTQTADADPLDDAPTEVPADAPASDDKPADAPADAPAAPPKRPRAPRARRAKK